MMVMTAKVDIKKILIILGAIVALIIGCILIFGGDSEATPTATVPSASDNDKRVQFLQELGWQVSTSPTTSGQVKIPDTQSEAFARYNELQKTQGYDLSRYAGKTVMRYVYKVNNFTDATAPVYATLLVYQNQIIGGDITHTAPDGKILPLKKAVAPPATKEEDGTVKP